MNGSFVERAGLRNVQSKVPVTGTLGPLYLILKKSLKLPECFNQAISVPQDGWIGSNDFLRTSGTLTADGDGDRDKQMQERTSGCTSKYLYWSLCPGHSGRSDCTFRSRASRLSRDIFFFERMRLGTEG